MSGVHVAIVGALAVGALVAPRTIHAQTDSSARRAAYGVYGGVGFNMHSADFRALPGVPNCCPVFGSGSGTGFNVGGLYLLPFSASSALEVRAGFSTLDATLEANESTTLNVNGAAVPGTFRHTMAATLSNIGIEPYLNQTILPNLSLLLGGRVAVTMAKQYAQEEELIDPATGTFENDSRVRNVYSGDLPDANGIYAAVIGGAAYELPMNAARSWILRPEVQYAYALTSVVSGLSWNANSLRVGIAILHRPGKEEERTVAPPVVAPRASPPPVASGPPTAKIAVQVADASGNMAPTNTFRIEEYVSEHLHPLLNYVFFDEGSAALASRYTRMTPEETARFHVRIMHNMETMPIYHHLLNIVGRRLIDNPTATLRIVGCRTETGVEHGDGALSRARAETVRAYLRDVWRIDTARLRVASRGLPDKAANENERDGVEENRRVELWSDNTAILEPVQTRDTLRRARPPALRITPTATSAAGVSQWTVQVKQRDAVLASYHGVGAPPAMILEPWNTIAQEQLPRSEDSVYATLAVIDSAGKTADAVSNGATVEQYTIEKQERKHRNHYLVQQFDLIMFDFDRTELGQMHTHIIKDIIYPRITAFDSVTIAGYTDRTGTDAYDLSLSAGRSRTVAQALQVPEDHAAGFGKTTMYDNDLPEGRFYCRTVHIQALTRLVLD